MGLKSVTKMIFLLLGRRDCNQRSRPEWNFSEQLTSQEGIFRKPLASGWESGIPKGTKGEQGEFV